MKIQVDPSPTTQDMQVIWDGLYHHNQEHVSAEGDSTFAVFLREKEGVVLGGIIAKVGRGWLHIINLWLEPSLRDQGYGSRLMTVAEVEGRQRGCHSAYLDTFSFRALSFYEKLGYEILAC